MTKWNSSSLRSTSWGTASPCRSESNRKIWSWNCKRLRANRLQQWSSLKRSILQLFSRWRRATRKIWKSKIKSDKSRIKRAKRAWKRQSTSYKPSFSKFKISGARMSSNSWQKSRTQKKGPLSRFRSSRNYKMLQGLRILKTIAQINHITKPKTSKFDSWRTSLQSLRKSRKS